MTSLAIFFGIALIALLVAWKVVRGQTWGPDTDAEELIKQIHRVDVEAFRNLVNSHDEDYLRPRISRQDFRIWNKMRIQAAQEYVSWISHNAVLLLAISQLATRSSDPSVISHGKHLGNAALSLRIDCLLAMLKLRVKVIYPSPRFSVDFVFEKYARVHKSFVSLRFAQHPASPSKAFAIL